MTFLHNKVNFQIHIIFINAMIKVVFCQLKMLEVGLWLQLNVTIQVFEKSNYTVHLIAIDWILF